MKFVINTYGTIDSMSHIIFACNLRNECFEKSDTNFEKKYCILIRKYELFLFSFDWRRITYLEKSK